MIGHRVVFKDGMLRYWCPGCNFAHAVDAVRWNWNGSFEKPTLSPSVRHFYQHPDTRAEVTTCHYFITDGRFVYCGDCPHKLAGQTIDMPQAVSSDGPFPGEAT